MLMPSRMNAPVLGGGRLRREYAPQPNRHILNVKLARRRRESNFAEQGELQVGVIIRGREHTLRHEDQDRDCSTGPLIAVHERVVADDGVEDGGSTLVGVVVDWLAERALERPGAGSMKRGGVLTPRT